MCKGNHPSPMRDTFMDLQPDFFEFRIFYLVVPRELLDHELGVCTELSRDIRFHRLWHGDD